MKNRFVVLLFALLTASVMLAAGNKSAKINRVWLEHGVTVNGQKAMKVHCEYTVQGMQGLIGSMGIWIKNSDNKWISVDGNATSKDGLKYFKSTYEAKYYTSYFSNHWIAPYIHQLHFAAGTHTYYVVVCICDNNGNILAQSKPVKFSGTGTSVNKKANNNYQQQRGSNMQVWREELGYGMFAINRGNPNGARSRTIYRLCVACRGSVTCGACYGMGRCMICNGQGGIVTSGYGTYIPCTACGMTGACKLCGGSGKCACALTDYPGYMPSSASLIDAQGRVVANNSYSTGSSSGGSGSSSSSSSNSSGSSGSCFRCHGTGVDPSKSSGGNLSSWVAHYNSSGSKCPYCGAYDEHWHTKCPHCNVPTR